MVSARSWAHPNGVWMKHTEKPVPTWVEVAGRRLRRRPRVEVVDDWPRPPQIGDVRIAEPIEEGCGEPRVVIVVAVDPLVASAKVVLASNDVHMVTPRELPLSAGDIDLPFDLMIEPDLMGELWWIQIGRRLGRLTERWIERLHRSVTSPVGGAHQVRRVEELPCARRSFRLGEETALDRLAIRVRNRQDRHGLGTVPVVVDPALLVRDQTESAGDFLARMLLLSRAVGAAEQVMIPEGALDLDQLSQVVPELRGDLEVALRPILERRLNEPASPAPGDILFNPGRVHGPLAAERVLANELSRSCRGSRPTSRLLTTARAWTDGGSIRRPAVLRLGDRRRVHLIRHDLEALL